MRYSIFLLVFLLQYAKQSLCLFLRVETGHQNIAIDGRDVYYGHFTKIYFHNLTCIDSIDIHCLKELTGAEEIDLLHSECHRGHWKVAHYTNSKHHFRLKQPVHALRLLISSRKELSVIDAQVASCSANATKQPTECHRSARNHNHRHGKPGTILRAVDPYTVMDDTEALRRFRRSIDEKEELISQNREFLENLIVDKDTILTINPGVNLKFGKGVGLVIYGKLHINGTKDQPVTMERKDKDGKWKGIEFREAPPGSVISHVKILGSDVAVRVLKGNSPYLENVYADSNTIGLQFHELATFTLTHLNKVTSVNNEKTGIEYLGKV